MRRSTPRHSSGDGRRWRPSSAALRSATDGRGRLVSLVGDVGAGKSRLVDELRAESTEMRVLRATGESYTSSTPYIAWRELLREMLDIGWEDPADVVLDRLTSAITESDPSLLPWLPLIALTLDVNAPPTPEVEMLAEEFRRAKLHEAMLRFLDVQLAEPTLIEIEDVQYMDEASAALLTHVVETVGERPWLIVDTPRGRRRVPFVAEPRGAPDRGRAARHCGRDRARRGVHRARSDATARDQDAGGAFRREPAVPARPHQGRRGDREHR